jgi:hypothetical protein
MSEQETRVTDSADLHAIRAQRQQIEEASEDQFLASWEWDRMMFCLSEECDRFNVAPWIKALDPTPTLRLEFMRPLWSRLTYLRGNTRHVMHVTYSVQLQCVAFEMHCANVVYKQYVTVHNGKAYFQVDRDSTTKPTPAELREEAARRILRVFFSETTEHHSSVQ